MAAFIFSLIFLITGLIVGFSFLFLNRSETITTFVRKSDGERFSDIPFGSDYS